MASGNPAKKAKAMSTAADFKNRNRVEVELPSGLFVKLRNPGGLRAFMGGGDIPNSLMPMIEKALKKGSTAGLDTSLTNADGSIDPNMINDMILLMDRVAVACMVEPPLSPVPADDEERRDDILYADEMPDDDKQFIFSWLSSGVTDLETFRQQRDAGMDSVAAIAGAQGDAELPVGTKTR